MQFSANVPRHRHHETEGLAGKLWHSSRRTGETPYAPVADETRDEIDEVA